MKKLAIVFSGLLLTAACGDDGSSNSGSVGGNNNGTQMLVKPGTTEACGRAGRSGETSCFGDAFPCQAGEYCDQELLICWEGCTSDNNCASNQFCDLTEGSPGTCLNCVVFTPQPSNNTPTNNTPTNNTPTNNTNGGDGGCETDVQCDNTPDRFHEICLEGSCKFGCRESSQCGRNFSCIACDRDDTGAMCRILDLASGDAGVCGADF